ncbi:FG-GAP repeat protein [Engelhardtia mirabilis]|uniref:FG-GAP repeat protein n=1 Tax=Engelhardtia mirabilis TaxID=2528011 RepID=A0A518BHJ0_9BACT|nr:hypothetical protein Pla133_15260 [Planctomycetes bacterium Pla133]QDV00778.1 hypothetical protein Pla86_15250 [Planctomycetes bacterium Pla86]
MHASALIVPALVATVLDVAAPSLHALQAPIAEVAKVYGSATGSSDLAGISVAISGPTALVAAQSDGSAAPGAGSVYSFDLQPDGSWLETQKLTASNAAAGDTFGRSVAISGVRAIVGASGKDGSLGGNEGAAYVFERVGGVWGEAGALVAAGPIVGQEFGWSVAIDGDFAAVGAYRNATQGSLAGAVYVFERIAGNWTQTQVLYASDASDGAQFGWTLAMDGSTLLVGADLQGPPGNGAGAVYVFEYSGSSWVETQRLKGSDTIPLDYFGWSVALEGDFAAIGATGSESAGEPFGKDEGAVYVFQRVGSSWVQTARLEASDAAASDELGYAVGIAEGRVLAGSPDQDELGSNAGAAYLFERDVSGTWAQTAKVLASDGQSGDLLGRALGLSGDRAIVGARGDDDQGSSAGAAYLLDLEPLSAAVISISLSAGGLQSLTLDAGRDHGGEIYLLLGSLSGTAPGVPLAPGVALPLNVDPYLLLTLDNPNQLPLLSSFASLNAVGHASAIFAVPPGSSGALAGLVAHHAFFTIDLTTFGVAFVSNALPVGLLP